MHKFSLFLLLTLSFFSHYGQTDSIPSKNANYLADRDAKYAISQIVHYCGLEPNFVVVIDYDIPNAQAFVQHRKRFIKYNPLFLKRISDSTHTDWAAWSVLAHEIGHHLLGHTIEKYKFSHENELAADKFSGFILNQMGATLEETIACINEEGSPHGNKSHPSLSNRKEAITNGWKESEQIKQNETCINDFSYSQNDYLNENYSHQLKFNGDINTYFINENHQVIWYDNYGNAILLSTLRKFTGKSYQWEFVFDKSLYAIDGKGNVWLLTNHGATILVGDTSALIKN